MCGPPSRLVDSGYAINSGASGGNVLLAFGVE
jgi:hypothetical protein